jgi:hypothetical protein
VSRLEDGEQMVHLRGRLLACACGPLSCGCRSLDISPRSDADGDIPDPIAAPFNFIESDTNWQKAKAWLGHKRAVELRGECEAEFKAQSAIIVGASRSREYDRLLRETIAKAIPELTARAATESSNWLRMQFAALPFPSEARSDAQETVFRTDSKQQEQSMSPKQETFTSEQMAAEREELVARRARQRAAEIRTDSVDVDAAERAMIQRHRTASLGLTAATLETAKDEQRRIAEYGERQARMDARERELQKARDERFRADANNPKCKCGERLDSADVEEGLPSCSVCRMDAAEKEFRERNRNAWRHPAGKPGINFLGGGGNDAA